MQFKKFFTTSFNLDQSKILLSGNGLTNYHVMMSIDAPEETSILKTLWGKGENAGNAFSPFPTMFSTI